MGSMRHRRNGNFESSRLLYASMSRSIDVSCSDTVSIDELGNGPWWLQIGSCQEEDDWSSSFLLCRSFPSQWPGEQQQCFVDSGSLQMYFFAPYNSPLCILSHFCFKSFICISVRNKVCFYKEPQPLELDGKSRQHIKMLHTSFKCQWFADHSNYLADLLLLRGCKRPNDECLGLEQVSPPPFFFCCLHLSGFNWLIMVSFIFSIFDIMLLSLEYLSLTTVLTARVLSKQ